MELNKEQLILIERMNQATAEQLTLGVKPASQYALDKAAAESGFLGPENGLLRSAITSKQVKKVLHLSWFERLIMPSMEHQVQKNLSRYRHLIFALLARSMENCVPIKASFGKFGESRRADSPEISVASPETKKGP